MGQVKIQLEGTELIRCDTCEDFEYIGNMVSDKQESGSVYYYCPNCMDSYSIEIGRKEWKQKATFQFALTVL